MSEETPDLSAENPPRVEPVATPSSEAEAPAGPQTAPLTPAVLVWPGKAFSQTWVLFWFGVAYFVSALLPWYGTGGDLLVLENGREVTVTAYQHQASVYEVNPTQHAAPAAVTAFRPRSMSFGAVLVLLFGAGMAISGLVNIWNRRLVLWPTTLCWVMALLALYYTKAEYVDPTNIYEHPQSVSLFSQLGEIASNATAIMSPGSAEFAKLAEITGRFGIGYYVCVLVQLGLIIFILGSIVSGLFAAKKQPAPKPAGGSAARRPGRR
jgi:hypothetical protein